MRMALDQFAYAPVFIASMMAILQCLDVSAGSCSWAGYCFSSQLLVVLDQGALLLQHELGVGGVPCLLQGGTCKCTVSPTLLLCHPVPLTMPRL
jgi:hypothetical protein